MYNTTNLLCVNLFIVRTIKKSYCTYNKKSVDLLPINIAKLVKLWTGKRPANSKNMKNIAIYRIFYCTYNKNIKK